MNVRERLFKFCRQRLTVWWWWREGGSRSVGSHVWRFTHSMPASQQITGRCTRGRSNLKHFLIHYFIQLIALLSETHGIHHIVRYLHRNIGYQPSTTRHPQALIAAQDTKKAKSLSPSAGYTVSSRAESRLAMEMRGIHRDQHTQMGEQESPPSAASKATLSLLAMRHAQPISLRPR